MSEANLPDLHTGWQKQHQQLGAIKGDRRIRIIQLGSLPRFQGDASDSFESLETVSLCLLLIAQTTTILQPVSVCLGRKKTRN